MSQHPPFVPTVPTDPAQELDARFAPPTAHVEPVAPRQVAGEPIWFSVSPLKLVVMHAVQERGVAVRTDVPSGEIFGRVTRFFDERIAALEKAGVARDRLILQLRLRRRTRRNRGRRDRRRRATAGLPRRVRASGSGRAKSRR